MENNNNWNTNQNFKVITVNMKKLHLTCINSLIKAGLFLNRAELIRFAINDFLERYFYDEMILDEIFENQFENEDEIKSNLKKMNVIVRPNSGELTIVTINISNLTDKKLRLIHKTSRSELIRYILSYFLNRQLLFLFKLKNENDNAETSSTKNKNRKMIKSGIDMRSIMNRELSDNQIQKIKKQIDRMYAELNLQEEDFLEY